jgi:hypothetical protein
MGPLAAAALLLAKPIGPLLGRDLLVAADVLLALVVLWFGRGRSRRMRCLRTDSSGRATVSTARREVVGAAVAVTCVALGTAVLIAFGT